MPPDYAALFEVHDRAALAGQDVDVDHVAPGGQTFHTRIRPVRDETGACIVRGKDREVRHLRVELAAHTDGQGGVAHVLSASVGVRMAEPGLGHEDALRDADSAMYRAKRDGRDVTVVFEPGQRQKATQHAPGCDLDPVVIGEPGMLGRPQSAARTAELLEHWSSPGLTLEVVPLLTERCP